MRRFFSAFPKPKVANINSHTSINAGSSGFVATLNRSAEVAKTATDIYKATSRSYSTSPEIKSEDISKKEESKKNSIASAMYLQSLIDGIPHEALQNVEVGEKFPLDGVLQVMKVMRESRMQEEASVLKKGAPAAHKKGFHTSAAGAKKPLSIEEQLEQKKSILAGYEKHSDFAEILGSEIKMIEQEIAKRAAEKEKSKTNAVVNPEESAQLLNETLDHVRG